MKNICVALAALTVLCLACSAEMRIWTSAEGQTVEAEFVRYSVGKIVLKKADGKEVSIPPSYLSDDDQEYVITMIPPKPPMLQLDFSKRAKTNAEYYDDHRQKLRFTVKIMKTSREPYEGKLTVELFVLGEDLRYGEKSMLLRKVWKDVVLSNELNDVLELSPAPITVHYDDEGYEYGTKYDGYAFFVLDDSGTVIASRASSKKLERGLPKLRKEELHDL